MKNQRLVNNLVLLWLGCYAGLTYAANTFAQDALSYDWASLMFAAFAGLLGGFLRTILTLAGEKRVVLDILRESWKDALVALVGGGLVYLAIQGVASMGWINVPRDMRILLVVGAGFSRGRWLGVIERGAADLVARGRGAITGGAASVDVPASAAMPLESKR